MYNEVSFADVQDTLPRVLSFSSLTIDHIDLFLAAPGYEDRATAIPLALVRRKCAINNALIWQYSTDIPANVTNCEEVQALLRGCGATLTSAKTVQELGQHLHKILGKESADRPQTVMVDLSTMSGKLILEVVSALAVEDCARVVFVYAEAATYGPTAGDFKRTLAASIERGTLGLDQGVVSVESIARMRGFHDPALQDLVLMIPGFSRDRARACINHVNPALLISPGSNVKWTVGIPHLELDAWRAEAMRIVHALPSDGPADQLSTFDFVDVYRYLEDLHRREWLRSNLTIAFLGSKLQGLGTGLFASVHTDTRVVVATPEAYSLEDYTQGVRDLWVADFPSWTRTLSALRAVGSVRYAD